MNTSSSPQPNAAADVTSHLHEVANWLFGPSDECVQRVAVDDSFRQKLPEACQQLLMREPFALRLSLHREVLEALCKEDPLYRAELLEDLTQRTEAQGGQAKPQDLAAGQIRFVDGVNLEQSEDGQVNRMRYTRALPVVLDEPHHWQEDGATRGPTLWFAWVVSPFESFASYWDVLLQGEQVPDEFPLVQVWNRVSVAVEHLGTEVPYALDADQLSEVRAVWAELITGHEPDLNDWPLTLGMPRERLTASGVAVFTGSPITEDADPRQVVFRQFEAAGFMVSDAASACIRAHVARSSVREVLEAMVRLGAGLVQHVIAPLPMGQGDPPTAAVLATGSTGLRGASGDRDHIDIPAGANFIEKAIWSQERATLSIAWSEQFNGEGLQVHIRAGDLSSELSEVAGDIRSSMYAVEILLDRSDPQVEAALGSPTVRIELRALPPGVHDEVGHLVVDLIGARP